MSAPAPQLLSRRANGTDSLPSKGKMSNEAGAQRPAKGRGSADRSGDTIKKTGSSEPQKRPRPKAHSEGEKLVLRRLPPGMTEAEFVSILGPDWGMGKGRVDWFSYCAGKVSTDPSKPSRPSRAYLHVMRKDSIMPLSQVVRSATWEDAKATFTSPSLAGPPVLEFAPYKKIPGTRRGPDPRQGTIDQDQEFMAFLEGLANPVSPRENMDADDVDEAAKEETKITTTPLVEYLKEKKANKGKDGGAGKNAKSGSAKGKRGSKEDDSPKKKSKDKAASEPVKILTKKAATEQAAEAARVAASQINASNATDAPKRRRAGIAAAAKILQRDLGLSPGSAHRRARHDVAKADGETKTTSNKEPTPAPDEAPAASADAATAQPPRGRPESPVALKSQSSGRRNRGGKAAEKGKTAETLAAQHTAAGPPVILKKRGDEGAPHTAADAPSATKHAPNGKSASGPPSNARAAGANKSASQRKAPAVTAGATRAFVKHANPSQGVSEAALRQAFETFGTVTQVEVDKRKGFAYVDFGDHEGLVRAVGASPVQVAQTSVQVVERKDKKPAAAAGSATSGPSASDKAPGRGRRGRGCAASSTHKANGAVNGGSTAAASTGGSG